MFSNAHHLRSWQWFSMVFAVLLALTIIPVWSKSTTLAAPPAQGTLPPRYTPTPEPTAVNPTTPPPPTDTPTTPPDTDAPGVQDTPTILLPATGVAVIAPGIAVFTLSLIVFLAVGSLAMRAGRRERRG